MAAEPPKVRFRARAEADLYVAKANAVVIRHASGHEVVAMVEIVSPGKKNSRHGLALFRGQGRGDAAKRHPSAGDRPVSARLLRPEGIHKAVWDRVMDNAFALPAEDRLTLAAYLGGPTPEYFVEAVAVGSRLPAMPLFLTPDVYVQVPLESTYQAAWARSPGILARGAGRK